MADFDPVERYAKPEEDERVLAALSRSHGLALEAVSRVVGIGYNRAANSLRRLRRRGLAEFEPARGWVAGDAVAELKARREARDDIDREHEEFCAKVRRDCELKRVMRGRG